ncbi:MAG: cytochrome c5 family protein [Betaproteobacteria bacterium]|nr:cytochrome c5 family protein [Betaproteobacteria bacterium]
MSEHESPIKTPQQLIVAVVLAFVVPIVVIVLLTVYVGSRPKMGAGSDAFSPEATAQRIAPIGRVASGPEAAAGGTTAAAVIRTGAQVYSAACAACHTTGALNAPKLGDASAWKPRLAQGLEGLYQSSMKGKGAMPAQGGGRYSDEEIRKATVHLANSAGGSFKE